MLKIVILTVQFFNGASEPLASANPAFILTHAASLIPDLDSQSGWVVMVAA